MKYSNVTIMRIVAAAFVMYGHMWILMGSFVGNFCGTPIHTLGFQMLLVIGGYLVTKSLMREKNRVNFILKRLFRIFPGLFVCLLLIILTGSFFSQLSIANYLKFPGVSSYFFRNITLNPVFSIEGILMDNPYPGALNGSLWALPVEMAMYLFMFLFFENFKKRRLVPILFVASVGYVIFRYFFFPDKIIIFHGTDWCYSLIMYPYFLVGALVAVMDWKKYCNLTLASLLLFLTFAVQIHTKIVLEILNIFVLGYFVLSFINDEKQLKFFIKSENDYAYGLFLYGFPIQQFLIQLLCVRGQMLISTNKLFLISFGITFIFAILSWHFVEKPGIEFGKYIMKKLENRRP